MLRTRGARQPRATLHRDMTHVMLLASFDAFAMFEALTLAYSIRSSASRPFIQPMSPVRFALLAAEPLVVKDFHGLFEARHVPVLGQRNDGFNEHA
mgnify:CR=1 FL=1